MTAKRNRPTISQRRVLVYLRHHGPVVLGDEFSSLLYAAVQNATDARLIEEVDGIINLTDAGRAAIEDVPR